MAVLFGVTDGDQDNLAALIQGREDRLGMLLAGVGQGELLGS
jgi:hypothetical protein